jgi:hypothetical protein
MPRPSRDFITSRAKRRCRICPSFIRSTKVSCSFRPSSISEPFSSRNSMARSSAIALTAMGGLTTSTFTPLSRVRASDQSYSTERSPTATRCSFGFFRGIRVRSDSTSDSDSNSFGKPMAQKTRNANPTPYMHFKGFSTRKTSVRGVECLWTPCGLPVSSLCRAAEIAQNCTIYRST